MKKYGRRILLLVPLWLLAFLFFNFSSARAVNDFVIRSFEATYSLSRDDPQGKLAISENISLTFNSYNHGILRAIPEKYGSDDVNPKVTKVLRDGKPEPFTTYGQNDNLVLKIGNADSVITGNHNYAITYTVENVIRFYDDYDELYWDVNGDQWLQNFESVTAHIVPPEGQNFSDSPAPKCFTGRFGSTEENCEFVPPTDGFSNTLTVKTTKTLFSGETLTFVVAIPKGYFRPMGFWEKYRKYLPAAIFVFIEFLVVFGAYRKWRRFGKDYPRSPVVAPTFGPPKKLGVLPSAFVYTDSIQPKHISASIIDLAVRGYIKIIETEDKGILKSKTKYSLELLKSPEGLTNAESIIVNALFEAPAIGAVVELDKKKSKLYGKMPKISEILSEETSAQGMYEVSPEAAKGKLVKYILLIIALIVVAFFAVGIFGWPGIAFGFLGLVIIIGLQAVMTKRSRLGNEVKQELEGLKLYLGMAEKDRLKMLQSANAPLAENAKEPKRTVKLFEKLLPYAIIFGVEKTWAEAFKNLYTTPPEWYQGNWTAFNTAIFVSHLNSSVSAVNSSFTAPSSSGSSGFSGGGGSAGGGGGGGGGGGW